MRLSEIIHMKKNIKIKTSSFRLSLTLKIKFKPLINKDFISEENLGRSWRDQINSAI